MRKVEVNYRIRLGIDFVFNNPFFSLLEGKYSVNDFDLQIIAEDGTVVQDFSNYDLVAANSYEGSATVWFKGNVKDKNLKYYFLNGSIDTEFRQPIVNVAQILDYCLYEARDNTFYCTRADLQNFQENFYEEITNIWNLYIEYYYLFYGTVASAELVSVALSDDGKVCKIKTRGFYPLDNSLDATANKLNRILPS